MHHSRHLFFPILVFILFSLVVSSCQNNDPIIEKEPINGPILIPYLIQNPIEVTDVKYLKNGFATNFSYLEMKGLVNTGIESKINQKIKDTFIGLMEGDQLPPYRGIKSRITDQATLENEQIYMYVTANFNNILSITIHYWSTYKTPFLREEYAYFSETIGLNFDLRTGNEITLKELFTDNIDYLPVLNDEVKQWLDRMYATDESENAYLGEPIRLIQPFTGLNEAQDFYLSDSGITLIFDYDNPEFETEMSAVEAFIPWSNFNNQNAITKRFYGADQSIYISQDPLVKSLLPGSEENDIREWASETIGSVNIYSTLMMSSSYPDYIQQAIREVYEVNQDHIDFLNQLYESEDSTKANKPFVDMGVISSSVSHYISVNYHAFDSIEMIDGYRDSQFQDGFVIDTRTKEKLEFSDIFLNDYDPTPLLQTKIRESMESIFSYAGSDLTSEEKAVYFSDEFINNLVENIKGFTMYTSYLYVYVPEVTIGKSTQSLSISISFEEIGCDNLIFFKE